MSYANQNRQRTGNAQSTQNRQNAREKAQNRRNERQDAPGRTDAGTPPATDPGNAAAGRSQQPASGSFTTVPGQIINQGYAGLIDWGNKYGKDNETVSNLVHGTIADSFRTDIQTGQAIRYNDAFLGTLGKTQAGLEDLKTGNTLKLMGAEGALADKLLARQGEETRLGYETQGRETREGYRVQGEEQRAGYRTMGEQERLTQGDKTNQELRLRADARGAIRSQGARFYG